MRLSRSRLTGCILAMLGVISSGAFASPLMANDEELATNDKSYRRNTTSVRARGQPAGAGSCRHRGHEGTSHRKVRIQHNTTQPNAQQKIASSATDQQKPDKKPQQPQKTEQTNKGNDKPSQAQSQQAAPSSTSASSPEQHADTSKGHGEVPTVQVPGLKQGQTAGKASGTDMVIQKKMQNDLVRLHNAIRNANGVGDVQWEDKLAKYSAGWMGHCLFEHSHG